MQAVSGFILIVFLAAVIGVIKPYTAHLNRWQFAVIAILALVTTGALAPSNEQGFASVFLLAFAAAALGIIKPFIERLTRWQFAVVAVISFGMAAATIDQTKIPKEKASADKVADADAGKKATKAPAATKPKAKSSPQSRQTTSAKSDSTSWIDEMDQGLWIVTSHEAIRSRLRDPDSADFRNSRFYSGGGAPVVCGEVNSKNGFGGYGGFERFIAAGNTPSMAFLASDFAAGDSIDNVWVKLCVKAERDKAYVP